MSPYDMNDFQRRFIIVRTLDLHLLESVGGFRLTWKTGRHIRACLEAMSLLASHWCFLSNFVSGLRSTNILVQARGTRQHLVRPAISLHSLIFFLRFHSSSRSVFADGYLCRRQALANAVLATNKHE
jgi:hypothetical protein